MPSTLPENHTLPNSQNAGFNKPHLKACALNPSTRRPRHDSVGLCVVHRSFHHTRTVITEDVFSPS